MQVSLSIFNFSFRSFGKKCLMQHGWMGGFAFAEFTWLCQKQISISDVACLNRHGKCRIGAWDPLRVGPSPFFTLSFGCPTPDKTPTTRLSLPRVLRVEVINV